MMKRTYTVIFVPHTGERHKKWRLTAGALKTLAVLAGAALIAAGTLTAHYFTFYQELTELRELRLGNAELKRQNLDYEVSVEHLNEQVGSLEDFVMKLSVMAGLGETAATGDGGIGGPADLNPPVSAYGQVKDELDRMRGELTDLEQQSRVLERFYAENTVMLASTPSIWPV